jgi:hypothetical protein
VIVISLLQKGKCEKCLYVPDTYHNLTAKSHKKLTFNISHKVEVYINPLENVLKRLKNLEGETYRG